MTRTEPLVLDDVDPFDLPDWLGECEVTWRPDQGLTTGFRVAGRLGAEGHELPCDLLAVDEAYPLPVTGDRARHDVHQAWRHGQILLVSVEGRLTLAVPGTSFDADLVLEALARTARAVGADPSRYAALLRISPERARRSR